MTENQMHDLKQKLQEIKEERKDHIEIRNMIMFGDGIFASGGYGHAPVPKKEILRRLCTRGVTVLLGERKTSKMCPCGNSELEYERVQPSNSGTGTQPDSFRTRCHKTRAKGKASSESRCAILEKFKDRDELATLNMLQCQNIYVKYRILEFNKQRNTSL